MRSAALGGHTKVVYLLAEQKDVLDLDKKRLTALYLAVQSKSRESVAILLSRGATPNPHTMPRPLDLLEQPPSKDDPLRTCFSDMEQRELLHMLMISELTSMIWDWGTNLHLQQTIMRTLRLRDPLTRMMTSVMRREKAAS